MARARQFTRLVRSEILMSYNTTYVANVGHWLTAKRANIKWWLTRE